MYWCSKGLITTQLISGQPRIWTHAWFLNHAVLSQWETYPSELNACQTHFGGDEVGQTGEVGNGQGGCGSRAIPALRKLNEDVGGLHEVRRCWRQMSFVTIFLKAECSNSLGALRCHILATSLLDTPRSYKYFMLFTCYFYTEFYYPIFQSLSLVPSIQILILAYFL